MGRVVLSVSMLERRSVRYRPCAVRFTSVGVGDTTHRGIERGHGCVAGNTGIAAELHQALRNSDAREREREGGHGERRVVVLAQGLSDRIVVGGDAPRFCAVALGVCCKSHPTLSSAQCSAWQRVPISERHALGLQCRKASSKDTGVFHGRRGA